MWLWVGLAAGLGLLALLAYWELVVAEGAHLGRRVVVRLYDLVAPRYEAIKKFDPLVEADILGLPLVETLVRFDAPRVLDAAAGTGRVARALLRQIAFDGRVFNLELSAPMLAQGRRECAIWPERSVWLLGPAETLPFPADTFDMVTCLEALEFLPDPRAALAELVRVLRPGGWLVVTNRVGWQAPLLLGKTFSRAAFLRLLDELPLDVPFVHPWQVDYDLAWGRKAGG